MHIENYTVRRFGYKTTYKTNSLLNNLYTDRQITYASYLAYKTNSLIKPRTRWSYYQGGEIHDSRFNC